MKYLLVLAVVVVAFMFWKNSRKAAKDERANTARPPAAPQDMVSCPVCSVHLPRGEALPGPDGRLYCSQEHRLRAGD